MGLLAFIIIAAAVAFGIAMGLTVLSGLGSLGSRSNGKVRELQVDLRNSKATESVAKKALYRIADPSCGAPALEAQNALDMISNLETKELM